MEDHVADYEPIDALASLRQDVLHVDCEDDLLLRGRIQFPELLEGRRLEIDNRALVVAVDVAGHSSLLGGRSKDVRSDVALQEELKMHLHATYEDTWQEQRAVVDRDGRRVDRLGTCLAVRQLVDDVHDDFLHDAFGRNDGELFLRQQRVNGRFVVPRGRKGHEIVFRKGLVAQKRRVETQSLAHVQEDLLLHGVVGDQTQHDQIQHREEHRRGTAVDRNASDR